MKWDRQFFRFLLVGVINTLVGTSVMFALYNIAGAGYWLSSACNYLVGGTVSYFLNKYFTFSQKKRSIRYIVKFIANTVICYLLAYGIAKPMVLSVFADFGSLSVLENLAMLVGMCIYTLLGYFGQRYFVFRD